MSRSFTLIELLIVIAIIAVLSVVVILALNPAELLKQARDSTRLSDMDTLNRALSLYQADNASASFGVASTTYLSFQDSTNATSTCTGLGIPSSTAPLGWNNQCAASSTYKAINGNGWIPVAFSSISSGSPLANLPADPVNSTSTNYRYVGGTNFWAVSAMLESKKMLSQEAAQDGGYDPGRYEKGTNLPLVAQSEGLQGWWGLNETSGATSTDSSGNGNNGMIAGGVTLGQTGKVGSAMLFDGSTGYIDVAHNAALSPAQITVACWFKTTATGARLLAYKRTTSPSKGYALFLNAGAVQFQGYDNTGTGLFNYLLGSGLNDGNWHYVVGTYNGTAAQLYIDGVAVGSPSGIPGALDTSNTQHLFIAQQTPDGIAYFSGTIDEVTLYSRALTAAEISAIYNATK